MIINDNKHGTERWYEDKGLKCAFLNIRHLLGKLDQLRICMDYHKPDIFGMCETFLNDQTNDGFIQTNGYLSERRDRIGRNGGGIFCYLSENLNCKRRKILKLIILKTYGWK